MVMLSPLQLWFAVKLMLAAMLAEHKIIIVGLDNAGKTTILYQL